MQDQPPHPFERLPTDWQQHPVVTRAWLADLSHVSRTGSHPANTSAVKTQLLSPLIIRVVVLSLLAATSLGIIKPEMLIKLLPVIIKLAIGSPF